MEAGPGDHGAAAVACTVALVAIVVVVSLYAVRHYVFVLSRLFGRQRHAWLHVEEASWPTVTVLVAAHDEEAVIAGCLAALLEVDYPRERLIVMPVNDRSTDQTREIIDGFARLHPGRLVPFHRATGKPGKAAALKDATAQVTSEVVVVFDADYLPPPPIIKQLVAPFFDPEVGATMGRVVPANVGRNLLTRLLDLERSGGYQVDQQARMNLGMIPQYGGTVGGIRLRALESVGGWHDDVLAEDTDLTFRLVLSRWKVAYANFAECHEEVPETWPVRVRQIMRWAKGHNQALYRHALGVISARHLSSAEKLDGVALLAVYAVGPLLLIGWVLAAAVFYAGAMPMLGAPVAVLALMSYGALGNFAAFFEIAAAALLDGSRGRIRLLPLNLLGFLVSAVAITRAGASQVVARALRRDTLRWDKTARYRRAS